MLEWSRIFSPATFVALLILSIADIQTNAQSTRRPIQASQACNGTTLVLSCPRGESIRIWQYGYVPPEVDCSRQLDFNFEIGKDSVSYYSNRFVSVARNAEPNLHTIVRSCNGQQRCNIAVLISPSVKGNSKANTYFSSLSGTADETANSQPGIRVLFSCELVQNYGIPSVRSICDRFEFVTSGRFHLRSPGYPSSAHRSAPSIGARTEEKTSCSCELRSNYGFNLVVIEMELANGTNSGFIPNSPNAPKRPSARGCSSTMRFWNASGHVGILPCVFEPKLRINWHDVIKQNKMGMSLEFSNDDDGSSGLMSRFWFEIQPRRSYSCPVFGCSLHECSGDADCHNPQHSCCCDSDVGLRVCKPFSPYDQIEQGVLNISCNKMVYSDSTKNLPAEIIDAVYDSPIEPVDSSDSGTLNGTAGTNQQPADEVLLGVVIGCAMFFAFMLLGASVFIYCYCRAQRSAGNLGVRPRLSKIGDNWGTHNNTVDSKTRENTLGNAKSSDNAKGGFILKGPSGIVVNGKSDNVENSKAAKSPYVGEGGQKSSRNRSFDSSFVDFEHDSNKNSVESRHVVGECSLKLPEDRLRLLGNDGGLVTGSDVPLPERVNTVDQTTVAIAAASVSAATDDLVGSAVSVDEPSEGLALPVILTCEVISSKDETPGEVQQKEMLIDANALQSPPPPDFIEQVEPFTYEGDLESEPLSIHSTASTDSGSIVAASIIYETVMMNPPLRLTGTSKTPQVTNRQLPASTTNPAIVTHSSSMTSPPDAAPKSVQGTPHQRFIMPGARPKHGDEARGKKDTTANSSGNQQMTTSPSKDSLSSVSGIIKLDIISAF